MRRNRKNSIKKERIIMLASSAFVLTALTMTGIYMKNSNMESQNDGYTLDFTAMEENADNKFQEIAQNEQDGNNLANQVADNSVKNHSSNTGIQNQAGNTTLGNTGIDLQEEVTEDDLDYMPLEVGSGLVEIPGLTDQAETGLMEEEALTPDGTLSEEELASAEDSKVDDQEVAAQNVVVEEALSFTESEGLLRPVAGDILMPYSMDKSIHFATLDQYKYNPAVIFSVAEGSDVLVCADAKVVDIFQDEEIGNAITLDLGDGYQATYGQLSKISVTKDDYVNAGDTIGVVAAPTKYYSVEGSNLYFQLTKDGVSVNPEVMFQ